MKVANRYGLDPLDAWKTVYEVFFDKPYESYMISAEEVALAELPWTPEQIGLAMDEYLDNMESEPTITSFLRSDLAIVEHELLAKGYWNAYHGESGKDDDLLRLCWNLEDAINTEGASDLAEAERALDSALIRLLG